MIHAYAYTDSKHSATPMPIESKYYTSDANGNQNSIPNIERRMYWDEDNRLMVLSDNGKTSRYTYNAAGERIMKSYGTMEGVYINGAPQGITFHETDNFTLYPASILSVNKNRFTKHYFIGDKRVASRIGTGMFNNVYGRNGSYVTAGQQDYAERMNQIQKQKEAYYKQQGIAPGVPTMKGAYGDPENTKRGYNSIIDTLGNHDVPQGWIQTPRPNTTPNTNPGPPVSWNDPSNPDDPQAGYGYIPNDTTKEETFFYHSDHLGSTSYITDDNANITQYDAYLPYGELLVDEHSSSEDLPYKFNGKQFDEETGLYYYGARYLNPVISLWYGVDPLAEKYPTAGGFVYCIENPVKFMDPNGKKIVIHYYDAKGHEQTYSFSGFQGRRSLKHPKSQFIDDFFTAYLYMGKKGGGKDVILAAVSSKYTIHLYDGSRSEIFDGELRSPDTENFGSEGQNIVRWQSRKGLRFGAGSKTNSPAIALEHEFDHAVDRANNSSAHRNRQGRLSHADKYYNDEEYRVIVGSRTRMGGEKQTQIATSEPIRDTHYGTFYTTISPISRVPKRK